MTSDYLTKALQGKLFIKHRKTLMYQRYISNILSLVFKLPVDLPMQIYLYTKYIRISRISLFSTLHDALWAMTKRSTSHVDYKYLSQIKFYQAVIFTLYQIYLRLLVYQTQFNLFKARQPSFDCRLWQRICSWILQNPTQSPFLSTFLSGVLGTP